VGVRLHVAPVYLILLPDRCCHPVGQLRHPAQALAQHQHRPA
jgi:hypothetical protein